LEGGLQRRFRRELYGRKPCAQFMDPLPLIINEDATVQEAGLLISRSAHHHLYDGFIVTDKGQYLGVGSAHDLMGLITEMQIQAARYANPLTTCPATYRSTNTSTGCLNSTLLSRPAIST
jgi:hypothetical protein